MPRRGTVGTKTSWEEYEASGGPLSESYKNKSYLGQKMADYKRGWKQDPIGQGLITLATLGALGGGGFGLVGAGAGAGGATAGTGGVGGMNLGLTSGGGLAGSSGGVGAGGAASGAGGGVGIESFLKNLLGKGKGDWLPYLLSLSSVIPSAKQSMIAGDMYEQGKSNYKMYMETMNKLLSARSQQHSALGAMISGGVTKDSVLPTIDYGKIFGSNENLLNSAETPSGSGYGFSSGSNNVGSGGSYTSGHSRG